MAKPDVVSAGYLIFCRKPSLRFLLMRHANRWDLPKGRIDPGETIEQAADRELLEETGFDPLELEKAPDFRFVSRYEVASNKEKTPKLKELIIFLGMMEQSKTPILTEHQGHQWLDWNPPHSIQINTIDPLLDYTFRYFQEHPEFSR